MGHWQWLSRVYNPSDDWEAPAGITNSLGRLLSSSFVFRGPFANLYLPGGAFTLRAVSFGLEHLGTFFLTSFILALDRAFCSWAVVLPPVPRDHRTPSTLPEG